jgi:hypothetical protein
VSFELVILFEVSSLIPTRLFFIRYITHGDMREMFCTGDGKLDATVLKMWRDGLTEIQSMADDKITFEEFRKFLKGQAPKNAMLASIKSSGASRSRASTSSTSRRRSSIEMISAAFVFQPVQEDSVATPKVSRDDMDNVLLNYDDIKPLLPGSIGADSMLDPPNSGDQDFYRPFTKSDALNGTENASSDLEAFHKCHEFRMSVLHASKLFDQYREARHRLTSKHTARLSMVAGARRPSTGATSHDVQVSEASERSGRTNRNNRKKTISDIFLLLRS